MTITTADTQAQKTGRLTILRAVPVEHARAGLNAIGIHETGMRHELGCRVAETLADGREYRVRVYPLVREDPTGEDDGLRANVELRLWADILLARPEDAEVGEFVHPAALGSSPVGEVTMAGVAMLDRGMFEARRRGGLVWAWERVR